MTWRTSQGERILAGAEGILFREAVLSLAEITDNAIRCEDDCWDFGVAVFDRLTPASRFAMLAEVGFAMLRETPVCPPLTSVNEATIATIYLHIEEMVHMEIDLDGDSSEPTFWRQLVLAACIELYADLELPDESSDDADEWTFLAEVLSDRILWDHDFNSEACFADSSPESAHQLYEDMGIEGDYFLAVPPDPRAANLEEIRKLLEEL